MNKPEHNAGKEINQRLMFLKEYGFSCDVISTGAECRIRLSKSGLLIVYSELYQFDEFNIKVYKSFDKSEEYHSVMVYDYGFFYKNVLHLIKAETNRKKFSNIELTEFYIRSKIEKGEDVFGIDINKFIS